MAFDYSYHPESRTIHLLGTGTVSLDDRIDCVRRMVADPTLPQDSNILIDVSKVKNPPAKDEVHAIDRLIKQLQARFDARIAILNPQPGLATLSHIIAFWAEGGGRQVKAFLAKDEACAWLAEKS